MNTRNKTRNAVHIKRSAIPANDIPSGPGVTLVRVYGRDEKIVESVALVERQDHTFKNCIKEIPLVTVEERSE